MLLLSLLDSQLQADLVEDGVFGTQSGHTAAVEILRQSRARRASHPEDVTRVPLFSKDGFLLPSARFEEALRYWEKSPWGLEIAKIEGARLLLHEGQPLVEASIASLLRHLRKYGKLPTLARLRINESFSPNSIGFDILKKSFRSLKHVEFAVPLARVQELMPLLPKTIESVRFDLRDAKEVFDTKLLQGLPASLSALDIQMNSTRTFPRDLGEFRGELKRLKELKLLRLDGGVLDLDAEFIDSLPKGLRILSLTGHLWDTPVDLAEKLPSLERLNLSHSNRIERRTPTSYRVSAGEIRVRSLPRTLTHLSMAGLRYNFEDGANEFAAALRGVDRLLALNLSWLDLPGDVRLLEGLPISLESLDLRKLAVTGRTAPLHLAKSLARLKNLKALSFSYHHESRLTEDPSPGLPEGLRALRLPGLFSKGQAAGVFTTSFASNLPRFMQLEYLELTDFDLLILETQPGVYNALPAKLREIHYQHADRVYGDHVPAYFRTDPSERSLPEKPHRPKAVLISEIERYAR